MSLRKFSRRVILWHRPVEPSKREIPLIGELEPQYQIMQAPPNVPVGCPPGLEVLSQLDGIFIRQQTELFEGSE